MFVTQRPSNSKFTVSVNCQRKTVHQGDFQTEGMELFSCTNIKMK